jgi:hypothetical protein
MQRKLRNLYFSLILSALGVKNGERKGHMVNMELAPQGLFGLLYTAVLIGGDPHFLLSPRIFGQIRGRYWSAKTDDISL